ncbi:MAG TPA: hypothetical protein VFF73_14595 [Planctomycetota bacterium]|nr:hypothetical protein [Planctomycetota bacterium]
MPSSLSTTCLALLALAACSAAPRVERISRTWSASAPTVQPDGPYGGVDGRLVIVPQERRRVSQEPGQGTGPLPINGYSIYDESGELVLDCPECTGGTYLFAEGRYIIVAAVEYGVLERQEKLVQFVIEPGRTTVVDFSAVKAQPVPEGAKTQPGSPQPGTGHSR